MPVDDRRTSRVVERASTRNSTATSLHVSPPTVAPSVDLDTLPLNPLPTGRVAYVSVTAPILAPSTVSSERAAIRGVIDAYRAYCERLDAVSAATLWRGVDTRALSRAFSTLSSQTLAFDQCDIEVAGARAAVVCNGTLSYVRRVGDQTPQSRRLSWSFDLERIADRWMISGVTAR